MPALVRSWTTVLNTSSVGATQALQARNLLYNRKVVYKAASWTVEGSSNSVAAGMDAVDRWAAEANVVRGTGGAVRSWIVFRSPANFSSASTYVYVLFSYSATNVYQVNITWSSAPFTGGSTTTNPTSASGTVVMADWKLAPASFVAGKYHYGYTTVGDVFFIFSQNATGLFATGSLVASAANPQSGELYQCMAVESDSTPFDMSTMYGGFIATWNQDATASGGSHGIFQPVNGGNQTVMTSYTSAGSTIDGSYPAFPAVIATSRNLKGTLVDIWLAPTGTGVLDGSEIPASPAASTHFKCGALWFPSNNTTPSL